MASVSAKRHRLSSLRSTEDLAWRCREYSNVIRSSSDFCLSSGSGQDKPVPMLSEITTTKMRKTWFEDWFWSMRSVLDLSLSVLFTRFLRGWWWWWWWWRKKMNTLHCVMPWGNLLTPNIWVERIYFLVYMQVYTHLAVYISWFASPGEGVLLGLTALLKPGSRKPKSLLDLSQ